MWVRPDIIQYQTFNTYLTELRQRIVEGCQLARQNLTEAGEIQRYYCNRVRKLAILKPNDEVLLQLSEKRNTLLTSWQGPFTVIKQTSPVNYIIDVRGNHKLFHVNTLKPYHSRDESKVEEISTPTSIQIRHANAVSMIDDVNEEINDGFYEGVSYSVFQQTESWTYIDNDY